MATTEVATTCYHCGEDCADKPVLQYDKVFCCEGCSMVYGILQQSDMCDYYAITLNPGLSQRRPVRQNKFLFLDDDKVRRSLISFSNEEQSFVTFYLPQIHCSSCLWLLENLHRIQPAVISSKVNFPTKEVEVFFDHRSFSLRQLAELLTSVGYEPYISLRQSGAQKPGADKSKLYKLGIAGFCFANIMLMSFPEYLGIDVQEQYLSSVFRYLNLGLSLPVFFYSASEFYKSAWKGIKHGFLNIDAPIVLAVLVTFVRSLYEVFSGTGGGYFDSMSGIVFFMLAGRVLQDKTYDQLNFERDYTSYFPIAVTRISNDTEKTVMLPDIHLDDTLLIHNEELIPADGIITRGQALIDYSFVTGESAPVAKEVGEIVYAGGKQVGGNIEILVIKEVAQSYLTRLWNRGEEPAKKAEEERSFVHLLSRYFTWMVFAIALAAAGYWLVHDSSHTWNAVTAVLIVACPCALLLSNTFTNGNILRLLGRQQLYLRNAQVIEDMAAIDHLVFDKTGTLTRAHGGTVEYDGRELTPELKIQVASLAAQSNHPMSKAVVKWANAGRPLTVRGFKETAGQGVEGVIEGRNIVLGSRKLVGLENAVKDAFTSAVVYLAVEGEVWGRFVIKNAYRPEVPELFGRLQKKYAITILSGDNEGERQYLSSLLKPGSQLLFNQGPEDKLRVIQRLQQRGIRVMMIGDGLNDAGALQQADVGIAVTEDSNCFTPASDAIMEVGQLGALDRILRLCIANRRVVMIAFVVSILYNIVGIWFAVQARLSPMIAAILMPASSLSILLITYGLSNVAAVYLRLKKTVQTTVHKN
ncbi:Cu+-exporting ATPase [Filimonas zeae]|nr:heavy metal translocating P-type ATPase metal-binding domain-containing protein [Filimonas zeae]MDR6341071.1 Cu+-exporting ATPase [Filimonas zeae]